MIEEIFITKSSEETQKIAQELAKDLKGDEVLAFFGNLGAGKTTFIQGLAKNLGVKERIISPTFIIIREHNVRINDKQSLRSGDLKGLRINKFYHVDLYRVQKLSELKELELGEILNSKGRIVAIEWAEKIKGLLPEKRIEIYFENISENERKITIKKTWMR